MLRGDHGEFWLEPVVSLEEKHGTDDETTVDLGAGARSSVYRNSSAGRPHLIFRRSAEQQQRQFEIGAGGGRSRRRRKKKRKQERNCGTRGENKTRHLLRVPLLSLSFTHPLYSSMLPPSRPLFPPTHTLSHRSFSRPLYIAICISRSRGRLFYVSACVYNVIGHTVVRNVGVSSTPCLFILFFLFFLSLFFFSFFLLTIISPVKEEMIHTRILKQIIVNESYDSPINRQFQRL